MPPASVCRCCCHPRGPEARRAVASQLPVWQHGLCTSIGRPCMGCGFNACRIWDQRLAIDTMPIETYLCILQAHTMFLFWLPILCLGSCSHKVWYHRQGVWYEPTGADLWSQLYQTTFFGYPILCVLGPRAKVGKPKQML